MCIKSRVLTRSKSLGLVILAVGSLAAGVLPAADQPTDGEARGFSGGGFSSPFELRVPGPAPGMVAQAPPPYPYYHPWHYGSTWAFPATTRKIKHPAPVYAEPRLGLHYLYIHPGNPYAYQFGIQMPPETDQPIWDPIHGMAQAQRSGISAEASWLLREGKYADAGRALARELRDEAASPEVYFLISSALVAVGKVEDAEIVFRQALETAGDDLGFLTGLQLPQRFPSLDAFREKVRALEDSKASPLMRGTYRVLAGDGDRGLVDLRNATEKDPVAKKVYLHFVEAAFGPPEPKPAADAKPGDAKPPQAESKKKESDSVFPPVEKSK